MRNPRGQRAKPLDKRISGWYTIDMDNNEAIFLAKRWYYDTYNVLHCTNWTMIAHCEMTACHVNQNTAQSYNSCNFTIHTEDSYCIGKVQSYLEQHFLVRVLLPDVTESDLRIIDVELPWLYCGKPNDFILRGYGTRIASNAS